MGSQLMGAVQSVHQALVEHFAKGLRIEKAEPFGNGHINDTFLLQLSGGTELVLQRINHHVFPEPAKVMENITRVCHHIGSQVAHLPDASQRHLRVWPTLDGHSFYLDEEGNSWRAYHRVRGVVSYQQIESPAQAYEVGYSFAKFQSQLSTLAAPRLHETIAGFHDTSRRYAKLMDAVERDEVHRLHQCQDDVAFAKERQSLVGRLVALQQQGILPERIVHNDTKLNNLLFDASGEKALCVVDLDTVMPGLVHYDFGDMIRTATNMAVEDEADADKIQASQPIFEELARGYLAAGQEFLTDAEVSELVFSGILMTFEVGIRFLTDYLEGDHYFKIHHPQHNLQRARAQFTLVRRLEACQDAWVALVADMWARLRG